MIYLILTIIVGFAGGLTALKLKVPAGAMVGSMMAVAAYNIFTGMAVMPTDVKLITQMAAGAFIGSGIKMKDVLDLKYIIKPAIIMVVSMIILNLIMGYIMHLTTGLELITCLFASAPGGIVDMSLISSDMGADTSKVAVMQMLRLIIVFTILTPMMKIIHTKLYGKEQLKAREEIVSDVENPSNDIQNDENGHKDIDKHIGINTDRIYGKQKINTLKNTKTKKSISEYVNSFFREGNIKLKASNLALTLSLALACGFVGYVLKIPAGTMTFAMIAVGALNIFTGRAYMPLNLRRATQVFAGILIGERMTYGDVLALKSVIVPALILLTGIIIVNLIVGYIISRISGIELVTALLASAPGGMSDMALIAKDLGGDAPKVAILQLSRYVCIVAFFPVIIKYVSLLM